MPCAKFSVRGTVQGVCFRASARAEAMRLHLTGYAKNLVDGSVEVLVCGEESALGELERWLQVGPSGARVAAVKRVAAESESSAHFRIL
jgi:acylphosphatase